MAISKHAVRKIMDKEVGLKKTEKSVRSLRDELEDVCSDLTELAVEHAEKQDRVTVKKKDVRKAVKKSEVL